MPTAQSLVAALAGSLAERSAAFAALEATDDAALAAGCVEALAAGQSEAAREVDAAEFRRCSLVLAHLATLDPVHVGAEYFRDLRCFARYTKGSVIDGIAGKDAEQMTKEDARTLAAGMAGDAAMRVRGEGAMFEAASITIMDLFGGTMSRATDSYFVMLTDEAKRTRLLTCVLDLLREDREGLSEAEIAGAWLMIGELISGKGATPGGVVALRALHGGALGLAIEELRTGTPAEWVSIALNPSGRFGSVFLGVYIITKTLAEEHMHLAAATPRLLDALLDVLKAHESSEVDDANVASVMFGTLVLYQVHESLFAHSEINRTAVRASASSIRFALDHPLDWYKALGFTSNAAAVRTVKL